MAKGFYCLFCDKAFTDVSDAQTEAIAHTKECGQEMTATIARLTRERDEARELARTVDVDRGRLAEMLVRAQTDRDEARAEVEKLHQTFSDWLDQAKADERARVVAFMRRLHEGTGHIPACAWECRNCDEAAGIEGAMLAIEAGEHDK